MSKKIRIGLIFAIGLVLAMWVSYQWRVKTLSPMSDAIRVANNVSSVGTKFGTLAYRWDGPDTGRIVLLVHGFSTPSFVFDKNIGDLSSAGFRVLRFDHFGRGFSDRPKIDYDQDFYDQELLVLLEALDVQEPVNLLGYSMGGGIVTTFAARHPEKVRQVALIAPVGMPSSQESWMKILKIPGFGEWVCEFPMRGFLVRGFKRDLKEGVVTEQMFRAFEEQFKYRNTTFALLSTLRHYPLSALQVEYDVLGKSQISVALIWGEKDRVVPYRGHDRIEAILGEVQFSSIPGDHGIPYTHSAQVNEALLDFYEQGN